jgi:hypothetical protein
MKAWHAKAHPIYLPIPTFACAEAIAGLAEHMMILVVEVELITSGGHILTVA